MYNYDLRHCRHSENCDRQSIGLTGLGLNYIKSIKLAHMPEWWYQNGIITEVVPAYSNMANMTQYLAVFGD